jgi:hypothetical protein
MSDLRRGAVSPKSRAERLMSLYQLRAKVAAEIRSLEAAMEHERQAIADALEAAERRPLCGTDSGYHHHRRVQKEPACGACKRAHAAYETGRALRQREAS